MRQCGTIGCTNVFDRGHAIQVSNPAPHKIEVCDRCFEEIQAEKGRQMKDRVHLFYRLKYYYQQGAPLLQYLSFALLVWGFGGIASVPWLVRILLVFIAFCCIIIAGWLNVERLRGPWRDEEESLKRSKVWIMRKEDSNNIKKILGILENNVPHKTKQK